jgi:hypothetical protein
MSRPGIEPRPPGWEARTLKKEPFEQLVNSYSEHLHMSARPVENTTGVTTKIAKFFEPLGIWIVKSESLEKLKYIHEP